MNKTIKEVVWYDETEPPKNYIWYKKDEDMYYRWDFGWKEQEMYKRGGGQWVSIDPQELTLEQQMQARKNQGLYNKRTELTNVLEWDGDITGKYHCEGIPLYKIDEPIDKDLLIGGKVEFKQNDIVDIITIDELEEFMPGVYVKRFNSTPVVGIVPENTEIYGLFWEKGLYFFKQFEGLYSRKLELSNSIFNKKVVDLIEPKFIEDLYYKENILPESIQWDGNIEGKELFPTEELQTAPSGSFYKISNVVLQHDDFLGGTLVANEPRFQRFREWTINENLVKTVLYWYQEEYLTLPNAYLIETYSGTNILIVYDTIDIPALSSPITPGVYFSISIDSETGEVYYFAKELKLLPKYQYYQIPKEYLPEPEKPLVVKSENYALINIYKIPDLSSQQVMQIYNSFMDGRECIIVDKDEKIRSKVIGVYVHPEVSDKICIVCLYYENLTACYKAYLGSVSITIGTMQTTDDSSEEIDI